MLALRRYYSCQASHDLLRSPTVSDNFGRSHVKNIAHIPVLVVLFSSSSLVFVLMSQSCLLVLSAILRVIRGIQVSREGGFLRQFPVAEFACIIESCDHREFTEIFRTLKGPIFEDFNQSDGSFPT